MGEITGRAFASLLIRPVIRLRRPGINGQRRPAYLPSVAKEAIHERD
jgi:hypothetical protein